MGLIACRSASTGVRAARPLMIAAAVCAIGVGIYWLTGA
jgi:hypothetical protein